MKEGTRVMSKNDGQRGTVVKSDELGLAVRLDRAQQTIEMPFAAEQWTEAPEIRLSVMQIARIAYEADRALMGAMAEYGVTEWASLKEPARIDWATKGPPKGSPARAALFAAIKKALL